MDARHPNYRKASLLLGASLGIAVGAVLILPGVKIDFAIVSSWIVLAALAVFAWMGYGWLKTVLLLFWMLGLIMAIPLFVPKPYAPLIIIFLTQMGIQLSALILLFRTQRLAAQDTRLAEDPQQ